MAKISIELITPRREIPLALEEPKRLSEIASEMHQLIEEFAVGVAAPAHTTDLGKNISMQNSLSMIEVTKRTFQGNGMNHVKIIKRYTKR